MRLLTALLSLLLLPLLPGCERPVQEPGRFQVAESLGGTDAQGFARAETIRPFRFPEDHGPHAAFRNEWWYLTGQLQGPEGHEFGFQVTFFRIALSPDAMPGTSAWRTNQVWMAHVALSDLTAGTHQAYERFARQAIGLAGADAEPFKVWLEDWQLTEGSSAGTWHLQIPTESFTLSLELTPITPVVLQGDRGLSQKSSQPGNASYYYSIPRLRAQGRLQTPEQELEVDGQAWLDREWSTSALGPNQAGWDWFSLQLDDGRNLMYYRLRRKDGSDDPHSAGSLSDASGLRRRLNASDVRLQPLRYWHAEGRRYPIEWRLQLAGENSAWRVRALLEDQEMRLSVRYWEGAVEVQDAATDKPLGRGYLELAGYD